MTAGQIIPSAITWVAAIAAVIAAALSWRVQQQARNTLLAVHAERRTFAWRGGEVTITAPMSNADCEALKEKWQREHGNNRAAHQVEELRPVSPVACSAYQPSTEPADSGLCAGCGMFDYKHREPS